MNDVCSDSDMDGEMAVRCIRGGVGWDRLALIFHSENYSLLSLWECIMGSQGVTLWIVKQFRKLVID